MAEKDEKSKAAEKKAANEVAKKAIAEKAYDDGYAAGQAKIDAETAEAEKSKSEKEEAERKENIKKVTSHDEAVVRSREKDFEAGCKKGPLNLVEQQRLIELEAKAGLGRQEDQPSPQEMRELSILRARNKKSKKS